MARVLVTGIAGQDGRILSDALVAEGSEVHGLVLESDLPFAKSFTDSITLHVGDLGQSESVASIVQKVKPDEIYNLGGISSVGYSWEHPVVTGRVSGLGAVAVMQAALELQRSENRLVRVLQASSSEIFGFPTQIPQTETTPISPTSPYGAAKAYAHFQAAMFRALGLPVSTVILYNHESILRPETFVTRKITAAAARIAHNGSGTVALGNLDARRDWGWAPDYVRAMMLANRHHEADDYVIATGEAHSVEEFVAAAFTRVGISDWRQHVVIDPAFVRPADPAIQVGDASKARRILGWESTVDFAELVGRIVDHDVAELNIISGDG